MNYKLFFTHRLKQNVFTFYVKQYWKIKIGMQLIISATIGIVHDDFYFLL